MKNELLFVNGLFPKDVLEYGFKTLAEYTSWERRAYEIYDILYGENSCENHNINSLEDLFGKEFSDIFYTQRNRLILKISINATLRDIEYLNNLLKHNTDLFIKENISNEDMKNSWHLQIYNEKKNDEKSC